MYVASRSSLVRISKHFLIHVDLVVFFFFSSRRRHTRCSRDWSSDVCSSDLIRLRTMLSDRRQLFDVGVAGPIAGFVVALPVLVVGLALSHALPGHGPLTGMLLGLDGETAVLGDSIITLVVRHLVHGSTPALLVHPVAFAGWVGMFVTMLNLLPISQLDGGHILYATLPRWQQRIALGFWTLIVVLGYYWRGWLYWGLVVLILSRGRLGHLPVLDAQRPLPASRRRLAWAALVLFVITFAPVPFRI